MPLTASDSGKEFKQADPGVHPAICYALIDLGTQVGEYLGTRTERHQVFISWELPKSTFESEGETKPMAISGFYTLSLNSKANLRAMLEGWRSREFTDKELQGFDLKTILGVPCLINIIHNKDGKARINGVMPASDEAKKLMLYNDHIYYSMEDGGGIPDAVPDGIKKIIMRSVEYNETGQQNEFPYPEDHGMEEPPIHGDEEDMPF